MLRRTVIFRGRVQGVGFRATVVDCVGDAAVTGTVRNLADGSVEAIFEGDAGAIDRVVAAIARARAGHIDSTDVVDGPATGEFRGFAIRR